jgi:hypothetical protein
MANPNPSPATRFKLGESGNPSGNRKHKPFTDLIYKMGMEKGYMESVVKAIYRQAIQGDMKAAQLLMDRVEGKAIQGVEISDSNETVAGYIQRLINARDVVQSGDIQRDMAQEALVLGQAEASVQRARSRKKDSASAKRKRDREKLDVGGTGPVVSGDETGSGGGDDGANT